MMEEDMVDEDVIDESSLIDFGDELGDGGKSQVLPLIGPVFCVVTYTDQNATVATQTTAPLRQAAAEGGPVATRQNSSELLGAIQSTLKDLSVSSSGSGARGYATFPQGTPSHSRTGAPARKPNSSPLVARKIVSGAAIVLSRSERRARMCFPRGRAQDRRHLNGAWG